MALSAQIHRCAMDLHQFLLRLSSDVQTTRGDPWGPSKLYCFFPLCDWPTSPAFETVSIKTYEQLLPAPKPAKTQPKSVEKQMAVFCMSHRCSPTSSVNLACLKHPVVSVLQIPRALLLILPLSTRKTSTESQVFVLRGFTGVDGVGYCPATRLRRFWESSDGFGITHETRVIFKPP